MAFFNLFRKPFKIQDDIFGEMLFSKDKDASLNYFEGHAWFAPQQRQIDVLISGDEVGATNTQKEFYAYIQQNYEQLKLAMIPLLNKELYDWDNGRPVTDFDKEFELENIEIPRIDNRDQVIKWSMAFVAKRIHHWANFELEGLTPVSLLIDG